MPIKDAAKKALRQSFRKKKQNLAYKNKIKSLQKEAKSLLAQGKNKDAEKLLPSIYKILDKAAKTGMIKKNAAAREKSRITAAINPKSRQ